jgi:NADH dehydrogenase FAD-containing subunit
VGVEFAGEIRNYYPHISVTLIHSRSEVLSSEPLPSEVKAKAKMLLEDEGVDLILGQRATINELPNGKFEVTLANGQTITADLALDTTKKGSATTSFLPAEALNEEQEIKVTPNLTFQTTIPNAASHFGVGDVIAWSGIKRAGGAMVMGQLAAANIYASILNAENLTSTPIALAELPHYPNVIGLAVGKQCLTYDKQNGMKWGVELMSSYFQDDLGWKANLRYLKLTDSGEEEGSAKKVEDKVVVKIKGASMGEAGVEAVAAVAAA